MVAVVQLVRASDCGSECRGFESHLPPNKKGSSQKELPFCLYNTYCNGITYNANKTSNVYSQRKKL